MFYKIIKWIGLVVLLLIIVIAGLAIWSSYKSTAYENTAVPYIKKVIPEISKWNAELMKTYMASETLKDVTTEDFSKMVNIFSKMGKLISIEEPVFKNTSYFNTVRNGSVAQVTYTVLGKYENGDAKITITLNEQGKTFKIYRFNLDSMALFK